MSSGGRSAICRVWQNYLRISKIKNVGTLISGSPLFTNDLLFSSADLHNFAEEDKIKYQNDMTTERDIQNQIDFAMDKGREEERVKIVEALRRQGVPEAIIEKALKDIKE